MTYEATMADIAELKSTSGLSRPTMTGYCRCGCGMRTKTTVERDEEGKLKVVEGAETRRGHHTRLKPTKAAPVKLSWDDVREIRRLFAEGVSPQRLSVACGIGPEYVRRILARKAWSEDG